jgi:flagellar biosynthesis protein FliR
MFAEINPVNQKFILIFFRTAAILWLVPVFSSHAVASYFKAAVSLAVAFLLFDMVQVTRPLASDSYGLMLLILREIFIGLVVSFFVRILFMVVTVAGEIIAFQAGFSFAQFMDPFTNTQVSSLVQAKNLLAMLLFFAMDAHHFIIKGLAVSFTELPLGSASMGSPLVQYFLQMTSKIFALGLRLGAPVIAILFLIELAMGLLSRLIPQINIFMEGIPLKILVSITVLSLSLGILAPAIESLFRNIETDMMRIFRLMV